MIRKYALLLGGLVVGALLVSGLAQLYVLYITHQPILLQLQSEKAAGAALSIQQTLNDIRTQLASGPDSIPTTAQHLAEIQDDMTLLPELVELSYLDASGVQLVDVVRSGSGFETTTHVGIQRGNDPAFVKATSERPYVGPAYENSRSLRVTIAVVHPGSAGRVFEMASSYAGATVAEVDLAFARQAIERIHLPENGRAFVVDPRGNVIADTRARIDALISVSRLQQVRHALTTSARRGATTAGDGSGNQVLSGYAKIDAAGWMVFVEQPLASALAPLNALALRLIGIVVVALLLALSVAVLMARRMVLPIQVLRAGAARAGAGDLTQPIDLRTGDEFETLAEEFNRMTRRLRESHETLEQNVRDRTQQLASALTEVEQKSRQLEAASRHKSEFLAMMSHELRTPLNAIIGFSEVLLERMYGELNPRQAEYLADIHGSGLHLLALINDILDLSKIEAGRMDLNLGEFSLLEMLTETVAAVNPKASEHGLTLESRIDPDLGPFEADERKVRQSVHNLLTNAVKFTPAGGHVLITARAGDGGVEIAVRDTGIGIAPDDQVRIFDGFQQVYDRGLRAGTGLGLTLARKFIELHGGRMWVESQPREGSTFTMWLPLRCVQVAPDPHVAVPKSTGVPA